MSQISHDNYQVQRLLNDTVKFLIDKYGGGEKYFDALDANIKEFPSIALLLLENIPDLPIITSGGFGLMILPYLEARGRHVILLNGSLRKEGGEPEQLNETIPLKDRHYIFLDDSYYEGRTFSKARQWLESRGCYMLKAYVVYDGSPVEDFRVNYLYRYHG